MLSYIELKNFKSFSEVKFDLRRSLKEPKSVAFIYGENGSGKSNLISSLLFLVQSFRTLENQFTLNDVSLSNRNSLNALKYESVHEKVIQQIMSMEYYSLTKLVDVNKLVGSNQPMSLKFGFHLDDFNGSYFISFFENRILKEELRYKINEREGEVFSLSEVRKWLSPTIFHNTNYKNELSEGIEKFWGNHSFMAVLFNELRTKNRDYIESKLGISLMKVLDWFSKFSVWCERSKGQTASISIPLGFLKQLEKGTIKDINDRELRLCEEALNTFFTQLYSDIKSVYYVFTPEDNQTSYELYFKKQIDGRIVDIPFSLESTGTRKLLDIYPMLFSAVAGASVFIDEIDSGVHDLLMKHLIEEVASSLHGQLIATTHNTLLMESLPTEQTYIIRVDANGYKTINCVSDYKERTQKNNNVRNKYLRGDYEGIPNIGYFNFQEIVDEIVHGISSSAKKFNDDDE